MDDLITLCYLKVRFWPQSTDFKAATFILSSERKLGGGGGALITSDEAAVPIH